MLIVPSDAEVDEQINLAYDNEGKFWGSSYEQGVIAAIDWLTGNRDDPPMED